MSALEIIEKIKALPKDEQRRVFEFVQGATSSEEERDAVRYVDMSKFRAAQARVFENHEELLRRLAQ